MAKKKEERLVLKCDSCKYVSMTINDAYGLPEGLVGITKKMHEGGHPGHILSVVTES